MALYEHIFMVRQDVSSTQVDALTQQFKTILEENQGSIAKTEYWGVRPLAYRVKKNRVGIYLNLYHNLESAKVVELETKYKLYDLIIKYMVVRLDDDELERALGKETEVEGESKDEDKDKKTEAKTEAKTEEKAEEKAEE